jgi:hypothetical protein
VPMSTALLLTVTVAINDRSSRTYVVGDEGKRARPTKCNSNSPPYHQSLNDNLTLPIHFPIAFGVF